MYNLAVGSTYSVQYRNLLGRASARIVRVMEVHPSYVRVYDYKRQGARTLRNSQISSPVLVSNEAADAEWREADNIPAVWLTA